MRLQLLAVPLLFLACSDTDAPHTPPGDAPDGAVVDGAVVDSAVLDGGSTVNDGAVVDGSNVPSDGGADASADAALPPASGEIGPNTTACAAPPAPASPLCEATGGGRCFYLDPEAGDDASGDGSFDSPWRSFANVVSYYGTPGERGSTAQPATAISLRPGDWLYLRSGAFTDTYNYNGMISVAMFRGIDASANPIHIKAYPGEAPVIAPSTRALGIYVLQSEGFVIEGVEVAGAYQSGIWIAESGRVTLRRVHVHDTDGVDNDNIAGVHFLGARQAELACSVIHDNYDRTNADTGGRATENSSNIVAFAGGGLHIHHNLVYQTPAPTADKTGGCIKYKHAATDASAVFEVNHNELRSCRFFAIGTGTQHSHIHHNLIVDGAGLVSRDFGGPTHQTNQRFSFNTLVRVEPLSLDPTSSYSGSGFDDPADLDFTDNLVVEARTAASQESGTIVIGPYASDALYTKTVPELYFERNCYSNTEGALHFALFAANGGSYGTMGAQVNLEGWRALGFDVTSIEATPSFIDPEAGNFDTTPGSACRAMGAYAGP